MRSTTRPKNSFDHIALPRGRVESLQIRQTLRCISINPKIAQDTAASSKAGIGPKPLAIFGIDRVTMWFDRPELPITRGILKKHCTRIDAHAEQMHFQARWKLRLEVFQPTIECLRLLHKACGNDVATLLTYAEIAFDLPAISKHQARYWRNEFLASARMRYQRHPVVRERTTWYFGRRANWQTRRANVLAVYADRPSKLNNAKPTANSSPCLHVEWRATGSSALTILGIVSLADLIQFDHQRFWADHIRLHQLPKPTILGRILARASDADVNVSGSALRKRGARWVAKYSINSKFVMHNALRNKPHIARQLETVPFSTWIKAMVAL